MAGTLLIGLLMCVVGVVIGVALGVLVSVPAALLVLFVGPKDVQP